MRQEAEEFYGVHVETQACPKGGQRNYLKMDLAKAVMPLHKVPFLVPDDSPHRMDPIPQAKYLTPP
jgi:hypothetical protein